MHFLRGFFVLLGFCYLNGLEAQITLTVPNDKYLKTNDDRSGATINFEIYPFDSQVVDLKPFKKGNPTFTGSDSLEIQIPEFESDQKISLLIGLMTTEISDDDDLIIIVAENFYSNKVPMYIDKNSDRNYINDGPPIVIKKNRRPRLVEITHLDAAEPIFKLWLKVDESDLLKKYRRKLVYKIEDQFSASLSLYSNIGDLTYNYDNLVTQYPTWYDVHVTGKGAKLALDYNFRFLKIGLNAEFQNLFHWTSTLNVRNGEPYNLFISEQIGWVHIENVEVFRNIDLHQNNRLLFSLSLAPRLYIRRVVEIQPFIAGGFVKYSSSGKYVSVRVIEGAEYKQSIDPYFEAGLAINFPVGYQRSIFVSSSANNTRWRPQGFFEDIPHENLEVKHLVYNFALGFRLGF